MALVEDFRAQWARQDQDQDFINAAHTRHPESTYHLIVELAQRDHVQWPQYVGHWTGDEWKLGWVTRTVRTKGGVRFKAGDIVIYRDRDPEDPYVPECATVYSVRGQIDCAVRHWYLDVIV